ncbi:MAG: 50S ribosomal protein L40e [Candidatus Diapherotrites archaeon]|nr:50S ribosomal protein L40e [Candidatus Diapherotrites archaeon]
MTRFKEADTRIFSNVWVCMSCNATNKGRPGEKPYKCRKCGNKALRLKRKISKKKK